MSLKSLFPTQIWTGELPTSKSSKLNRQLALEAYAFREMDSSGQKWSRRNYDAGYTSYGTITDLPYRSPSFAGLKKIIDLEVKKYLDKALDEKQGLRGTLLGLIAC